MVGPVTVSQLQTVGKAEGRLMEDSGHNTRLNQSRSLAASVLRTGDGRGAAYHFHFAGGLQSHRQFIVVSFDDRKQALVHVFPTIGE